MKSLKHHKPASQNMWSGRVDSIDDQNQLRWHQKIQYTKNAESSFVIAGFACDEGVRRNQGRTGAATGPTQIRKHLSNLAWHFDGKTHVYDMGDIHCKDGRLEESRSDYTDLLTRLYSNSNFVIGLGGGHEIAHPHGLALYQVFPKSKIGIINFDAHFDLRPLNQGKAHSGSPFLELAQHCQAAKHKFKYCCIGIQQASNTPMLFKTARQLGVTVVTAAELRSNFRKTQIAVRKLIKSCDKIYLTICLDVLGQSFAPGVSAPSPLGLSPQELLIGLDDVIKSRKVVGFDVAELAPNLDRDDMTAKLAAQIIDYCTFLIDRL